jgi:hypothetical protein
VKDEEKREKPCEHDREFDSFGYPRLRKMTYKTDLVTPHYWFVMNHGQDPDRKPVTFKSYPRKTNEVTYRNHADYKSNFAYDTHEPALGYGYSYRSRLGRPCSVKHHCCEDTNNMRDMLEVPYRQVIEGFGENQNNKINMNLVILLVLFVFILSTMSCE